VPPVGLRIAIPSISVACKRSLLAQILDVLRGGVVRIVDEVRREVTHLGNPEERTRGLVPARRSLHDVVVELDEIVLG
jgi:hypothetical protein